MVRDSLLIPPQASLHVYNAHDRRVLLPDLLMWWREVTNVGSHATWGGYLMGLFYGSRNLGASFKIRWRLWNDDGFDVKGEYLNGAFFEK